MSQTIFAKRTYALMQFGYWTLFATLLIKLLWLDPPPKSLMSLVLAVQLIPLLLPLRGIMAGKTYTTAWASFLALGYFAYSVALSFDPPPIRQIGLMQTLCSVLWFSGCVAFTRYQARALKSLADQNITPKVPEVSSNS